MTARRLITAALVAGGVAATAAGCVPAPTANPGYATRVLAYGGTQSKPDDITELGGRLYVSFQNGVGPLGQPTAHGQRASTIVEFTLGGKRLRQWNVTGKCDGLTADPTHQQLIGTVNEDGNSSLFTLTPAGPGTVRHYAYTGLTHGGGTDSISITTGRVFIAASAPTPAPNGKFTRPALYEVTLTAGRAALRPVLADNAVATDAATGRPVRLNLSDPDSTEIIPVSAPRYAGDLLLDSQGDSQQVYLAHPGTPQQTATVLTVGTQVNDTAVATSRRGSLYLTDNANNTLDVITGAYTPGAAYTTAPADSGVGSFLGTLNLTTGAITPFAINLGSPAGLLYHPNP